MEGDSQLNAIEPGDPDVRHSRNIWACRGSIAAAVKPCRAETQVGSLDNPLADAARSG